MLSSGAWVVRSCGSCMDLLSENEVYQKAQLRGGELCPLQENGPKCWAQRFPPFVCVGDNALRPGQSGPCPGLCDSESITSAFLCFCLSTQSKESAGPKDVPTRSPHGLPHSRPPCSDTLYTGNPEFPAQMVSGPF